MKKTNVIILGLIALISLGITVNLLFGSDESNELAEEDVELASGTNQVDLDRQLDKKEIRNHDEDDTSDDKPTEKQASYREESDINESNFGSDLKGTNESNSNSNEDNSNVKPSSESMKETTRSDLQDSISSEKNISEPSENEQSVEEKVDEKIPDQDLTNEDYPEEAIAEIVSLIIDARSNDGNSYLGEVTYDQGDTALDALLKFASQKGVSVKLAEDNSGEIFEIDGHTNNEDGGQWILYIDGYRSVNKPSSNKIAPNTTVRYHYKMNTE